MSRAEVAEKFAHKEYPIHIIGRHVDVTEAMKNYAIQKLSKINRSGERIREATVVMDIQKLTHTVDFIVYINNTKIKVSGHTTNMYASIDEAIFHLETKLRRYSKRLHDHHTKGIKDIEMTINVVERVQPVEEINDQIEAENQRVFESQFKQHAVTNKETRPLKLLTQAEAVMKMELSEDHFMVYRGEEDRKLKVIYRRSDGNYGIIQTE